MKSNFNLRANIALGLIVAVVVNSLGPLPWAQAQEFLLPAPGVMVHLSPAFTPALLKGIIIHPENAFKFDFIIYKGDQAFTQGQKKEEYTKLIKYFMASLATPDEDQWVNLSPYEKDRIIKDDFGKTAMGRDLLAQDYLLKQITASLIYPQDKLGQQFWDQVYERAYKQYGTTNIPVNTFNKVWIVPDDADIYEKGNVAYLYKSHLKVMLEEDYLSLQKHSGIQGVIVSEAKQSHTIASQVVRDIILPQLEKEVNDGKNFAPLRQVFSGMILAAWYKRALRESLLSRVYANKAEVKGIDQDPKNNEVIYQQYLKAYKKGVFNFIKEDADQYTHETIPRKYFSGGTALIPEDAAMGPDGLREVKFLHRNLPDASMRAAADLAGSTKVDLATVSVDPNQYRTKVARRFASLWRRAKVLLKKGSQEDLYKVMAEDFWRSVGGKKYIFRAASPEIAKIELEMNLKSWLYSILDRRMATETQSQVISNGVLNFLKSVPAIDRREGFYYRVQFVERPHDAAMTISEASNRISTSQKFAVWLRRARILLKINSHEDIYRDMAENFLRSLGAKKSVFYETSPKIMRRDLKFELWSWLDRQGTPQVYLVTLTHEIFRFLQLHPVNDGTKVYYRVVYMRGMSRLDSFRKGWHDFRLEADRYIIGIQSYSGYMAKANNLNEAFSALPITDQIILEKEGYKKISVPTAARPSSNSQSNAATTTKSEDHAMILGEDELGQIAVIKGLTSRELKMIEIFTENAPVIIKGIKEIKYIPIEHIEAKYSTPEKRKILQYSLLGWLQVIYDVLGLDNVNTRINKKMLQEFLASKGNDYKVDGIPMLRNDVNTWLEGKDWKFHGFELERLTYAQVGSLVVLVGKRWEPLQQRFGIRTDGLYKVKVKNVDAAMTLEQYLRIRDDYDAEFVREINHLPRKYHSFEEAAEAVNAAFDQLSKEDQYKVILGNKGKVEVHQFDFTSHEGVVTEIRAKNGQVIFQTDEKGKKVTVWPADLKDGLENARIYQTKDGSLVGLFSNFDAHRTVVYINDVKFFIANYGYNNESIYPGPPQVQDIALIRPLWPYIKNLQVRKRIIDTLEWLSETGPHHLYTYSGRYRDIDNYVADHLDLPDGAKIHDTSAGTGITSLELEQRLAYKHVHVVFSDNQFEFKLVRQGDGVMIFDSQGKVVSGKHVDSQDQSIFKELWREGQGMPFDRMDLRVGEYMAQHPNLISRRTIDLLRDPMPAEEFNLVRNMNLIQYFGRWEDKEELIKRLGRTVKNMGWLMVGFSGAGELQSYMLWQRKGSALFPVKSFSSEKMPSGVINLEESKQGQDQAMGTKGGIDMNAALLHMNIKRDGNGVPLPVDQQDLDNIHIDGLVPVILDIRPAGKFLLSL